MAENGYVRITGRLKDVIEREGVEIHPVEVDEILYRHKEISEARVFGFPCAEKGQEVAAWVRLKEGFRLDVQTIRSHVETSLPREKMPSFFKVVSEFPMTRSGEVRKFRLAELARREYA